ncbi:DUF6545 domain-containing protein [Streptomyces sp. NPDC048508]|uniref:DUF6545 domain-containing protein n=1 Tax=Streptomyces sp. NPDC048508 TaxID=3365561 RepID=UPI0037185905
MVVLLAGTCFALGSPSAVADINRLFGSPNAAVPVTYSAVTAFSASTIVLMIRWRGGLHDQVQRAVRRWRGIYTVIIISQVTLFFAGNANVERRTDFDTYYAKAPFLREMIVLYLVAHTGAMATTAKFCWQWIDHTGGRTRTTLKLFTLGWVCNAAYGSVKLSAVTARWFGHDMDELSTGLAPVLACVGAAFVATGYLLPAVGSHLDGLVMLLRLRPLARLLIKPSGKQQFTVALSWILIADIELRVTKRTTAIRDALSRLSAHLDDRARQDAYNNAIAGGAGHTKAEFIGTATMIAVAAQPGSRHVPGPHRSRLDAFQADLLPLAQSVRAPIVQAVVRTPSTSDVNPCTVRGCRALDVMPTD